jgi:hypothetical protein
MPDAHFFLLIQIFSSCAYPKNSNKTFDATIQWAGNQCKKVWKLALQSFSQISTRSSKWVTNISDSSFCALMFWILILCISGGRRGIVTLSHVLQFSCGTDEEPVLGFTIKPTLMFVEATTSFLPMANTCINSLLLPRPTYSIPLPEAKSLFSHYDYAFTSAYFGNR